MDATPANTGAAAHRRRVLVVDGHPIVPAGLAALIEGEPEMRACGLDTSAALAVAAARRVLERGTDRDPPGAGGGEAAG